MKSNKLRLKETFLMGLLLLFLASCDNDGFDNRLPDCSADDLANLNAMDRQVVGTLTDVNGTVDDSFCGVPLLVSDLPEDSSFSGAFFCL